MQDDFYTNLPGRLARNPDDRDRLFRGIEASKDMQVLTHYGNLVFSFDNRTQLEAVSVPTLVLSGGRDQVTPPHMGRLLEDGIVAEAARKCTTLHADALTDIVTREHSCIHAGETSGAIRLSGDFHLMLADIAGNRPLRELLRQLVAQTSLAIARYVPPGSGMCDDDDHDRLLAAISSRDAELSREIMHAHLTECERCLMLENPEGSSDLHAVFADVVAAQ